VTVYRQSEAWLAARVAVGSGGAGGGCSNATGRALAMGPAVDTTGCAIPKATGKYPPIAERDVLGAILEWLPYCKAVAWFARMNSGAQAVDGRYVRFGFKGCSDIIGQLRDGRFMAIEVKRSRGQPTEAQVEFLSKVQRHRGVAFVAHSLEDVQTYFAVMAKGKQ
jgi:hypothetical protein